jgi:AcrR family transcriptional regulator
MAAKPNKTRERILTVSLAMFNDQGEPNVTTNHIADELEISPGNLYYHFRNKDDIVEHLFERYEERMDQAMLAPEDRPPELEDIWLQLHLVFECIWEFRFLYRDLVDLLLRSRKLKMRFARILKRAHESIVEVCQGLAETGVLNASRVEIEALAYNIAMATTFWLNFEQIRPQVGSRTEPELGRGIYQVMMLLAPFMRDGERQHLNKLAEDYLRA